MKEKEIHSGMAFKTMEYQDSSLFKVKYFVVKKYNTRMTLFRKTEMHSRDFWDGKSAYLIL